jgi:tetratricopeptide (TPR) repeat protein
MSLLRVFLALLVLNACRLATTAPPHFAGPNLALRHYAEVVEANPDSESAQEARLKAAQIYYHQLDNTEKGLSVFQTIVDRQPTSPQARVALWTLAEHDFSQENYSQAHDRYLQYTLDFSTHQPAILARRRIADCLFHQARYDDALQRYQDYNQRFAKAEDRPQVLLRIAEIYTQIYQVDLARQTYTRLLVDFPQTKDSVQQKLKALGGTVVTEQTMNPEVPIQRTDLESQRRQTSEAGIGPLSRPNASTELASWKSSPIFKYNAKRLLRESGMLEVGEVRESLASDGVLLDDVVMSLGQQFYMIGDYLRAGACLEKTVALGIQKPEVYLKLGVCYKKAGAWDLARRTFVDLARIDLNTIHSLVDNAASQLRSDPVYAQKSLEILVGISTQTDRAIQQIQPGLVTVNR